MHLAAGGLRAFSLVAVEDGRLAALAQAATRDAAWHVVRLLTRNDLPDAESAAVMASLLAQTAQSVAEHGAARIHARVERDSAACEAFARSGFAPYSYESVYWLAHPLAQRPAAHQSPIRPQENKDAWGIYQLYCAVAPRVVQVAEGVDASSFDLASAAALRAVQNVGDRRWVLDVNGDILGYMRTQRLGRRLALFLHPEAYRFAGQMVAAGLTDLWPLRNIRCALPEYQSELGTALETAGLRFVGTQVVMVKQLVVLARAESRARRPVLERTLGPARTSSGH